MYKLRYTFNINLCKQYNNSFGLLCSEVNCQIRLGWGQNNNVHTSNQLPAKVFLDTENDHAHAILRNNRKYNLTDNLCLEKYESGLWSTKSADNNIWAEKETSELIEVFGALAVHCQAEGHCISNERYNDFFKELVLRCRHLNDDEIITTLKILSTCPPTESINSPNFLELWSALDRVCTKHIQRWNVSNLLYIADHWYNLKLSKTGQFTWESMRKISRKITKLTPPQLVQTMFYLNLCRRSIENMIDFEINLERCLDKLSIDEISILCMGFFKTKTPIRDNKLLERIYLRLQNDLKLCSDITLVNILKSLRYSSKVKESELMKPLLDVIAPEIPRLSLLSCLHVALLGTDIQKCHDGVLEPIIKRFIVEIKMARLKDMERISFIISLYDYENQSRDAEILCSKILEELPLRIEENTKYPKCLAACLHYLTLKGFTNKDILDTVLSEKFIHFAYGKHYKLLGRELFSLDSYSKINLKDSYEGSQLNAKMIRSLAKFTVHYIPERSDKYKITQADALLLDVKEAFEDLYQHATIIHILPHYERPDILVAYDTLENKFIDMKSVVPTYYSGTIISTEYFAKSRDMSRTVLISIVIGGWNSFVRDTDKPTGIFKMKMKQLEMIGYKVILVPWTEWRSSPYAERKLYLNDKLKLILEEEKQMMNGHLQ